MNDNLPSAKGNQRQKSLSAADFQKGFYEMNPGMDPVSMNELPHYSDIFPIPTLQIIRSSLKSCQ